MASLSQGRTAAAQCGLFTHKSVPVIFEPPCIIARLVEVDRFCPTTLTLAAPPPILLQIAPADSALCHSVSSVSGKLY